MLKLYEPFRGKEFFDDLSFSTIQIWVLSAKDFFAVFADILTFGSGSVDPHTFADPDPGSQNVADPDLMH